MQKAKQGPKIEPIGINNRLTDHINDKLLNIVYDAPTSKTLNIYNNSIYYMQKIWIRTPILKIFRPMYLPTDKCKKSVPLTLLLNDMVPEAIYLHTFIKRLELKITKQVKLITNNNKLKNKSALKNIENFPPIFNVNMPFNKLENGYEFNFHIYNAANQRINIESIKNGKSTSLYLELTSIWINDTHFGYNWNIMQMKLYPELEFNKCLFDDEEVINNAPSECYHCLYCPNNHIRTLFNQPCYIPLVTKVSTVPVPPPMPKTVPVFSKEKSYVPTVSDILSIKLKPVTRKEKEESDSPIDLLKIKEKLI